MRTIRFGVIGCGLMGREFASAAARWCHLTTPKAKPEIVAVCNRTLSASRTGWFSQHFPSVDQVTSDYRELLDNPDVDAVYCALPHNLHREVYRATIDAGKHLMGEKPFGIDLEAADAILASTVDNPHVFVRCASQFPFAPAVQRMGAMAATGEFGEILEVGSGFLHSSDLNPDKPINWKRRIETNGEYGVMGDLGMHVCHFVFRAGWQPRNVRAVLSNIVPTRPTPAGTGLRVPCETWDNATLLCETENTATGRRFPWVIKTQRIAPGERNTWYLEIKGTRACARYSTRNSNELQVLHYSGGEQNWQTVQTGHDVTYGSITGGIFEFGFSDAILQMWAAFLDELMTGEPAAPFAGCATPAEAHLSHRLFTAALLSQKNGCVATV